LTDHSLDLAEAWPDLARSIDEAASAIAELAPRLHPLDVVEGHRLYLRYLGIGIDSFVEHADPLFPVFYSKSRDGVRKFAGDSPPQLYDTAAISGDHEYEVIGSVRDVPLLELGVYSGDLSGLNPVPRRLISHVTEADLTVDPEGRFRLVLSADPARADLLLAPDASVISARRYLRSPFDRPDPLTIRRLGDDLATPPLTAPALATGVRASGSFAVANLRMWAEWTERMRQTKHNVMTPMADSGDIFTPAGHHYVDGFWELPEPDSALLIEFTAPPAEAYWSLVPMNYWMESFEWRFGDRVFASSFDTAPGADGVVRLAIADRDPGLPGVTWLRTLGHRQGLVSLRLARLTTPAPEVSCRLA